MVVFGVLILVFVGLLAGRGLSKGIDFTGGHNYVIQFEKNITDTQVKEAVLSAVEKSDEPSASVAPSRS